MANYTPPEVLEQICQHLETCELKIARCICRSFAPVARRYLFRDVLIRSNLKSFQKLSYISRHHTLKNYVQKLTYDGMLFGNTRKTFDGWHKVVVGDVGQETMLGSRQDTKRKEMDDTLLPVELQYHYSQYRYYVECQRRILANDDDLRVWLLTAFKAFQNLEAIRFETENIDSFPALKSNEVEVRYPTSVGRETLLEPTTTPMPNQRIHILLSLFSAARESRAKLKSVVCDWIPCEAMNKLENGAGQFDDILSRLRSLKLRLIVDDIRDETHSGQRNCAHFVSKAMMLRTLHLDFRKTMSSRVEPLIRYLEYREHWPSLKSLRFSGITTDWRTLQSFLTTHAHTLRSLELNDIVITTSPTPLATSSKSCSWVSIIQCLQSSLQLKHVRLQGQIFAPGEGWTIQGDDRHQSLGDIIISDESKSNEECLRDRIHQYILKGGAECPLRPPGTNGCENPGDFSWRYTTTAPTW